MNERPDLVEQYLGRLDEALVAQECPEQRRREIVEEVRRHIEDARALSGAPEDEASLRTILDHLGDPEEIASESRPEPRLVRDPAGDGRSRIPRRTRWLLEGAAGLVLLGTIAGLATAVAAQSPSSQRIFAAIAPAPVCVPPPAVVIRPRNIARVRITKRRGNQISVSLAGSGPATFRCVPFSGPALPVTLHRASAKDVAPSGKS